MIWFLAKDKIDERDKMSARKSSQFLSPKSLPLSCFLVILPYIQAKERKRRVRDRERRDILCTSNKEVMHANNEGTG